MILSLLKQQTRYNLVNSVQTITYWVKSQINKLVKEELRLETEVEKDNFKIVVEQFTNQMKTVI